jgi:hypothetical protein
MLVDGIRAADGQNAHAIKFSRRRMVPACIVGPQPSWFDFAAVVLASPLFPFASFRAHDFD